MHFFWPSLRCKVIEQMAKSRYLVEFPAQKKEPKWFQILGRFKKNSSCSVAKKSPKNWTGPCLSLNMVRRKRFIKWQTLSRNAKSSFEGTNPTPPSPMQQWRPPARTTIVSRTVGGLGSEGNKTLLLRHKNWNPLVKVHSASAPWLNHCRSQCGSLRLPSRSGSTLITVWVSLKTRVDQCSHNVVPCGVTITVLRAG